MRLLLPLIFLTAATPLLAADRVERRISAKADASQITAIVIELPASALEIRTHSEPNVTASGLVTRAWRGEKNRAAAEARIAQAGISMQRRGRILYISRDLGPGGANFWNSPNATQYELTILVPVNVPIDLNQNAGTLDLEGRFGDLDVRLGAGDLVLRMPHNAVGELDAATTVGELKTDLGPRVVEKSGVIAGSTTYLNPGGTSSVRLRVRAGSIDVTLTE